MSRLYSVIFLKKVLTELYWNGRVTYIRKPSYKGEALDPNFSVKNQGGAALQRLHWSIKILIIDLSI